MSYTFHQTGAQIQDILDKVSQYPTLTYSGTISSLPVTISKTGMTTNHRVVSSVLGTPSAQTSDWTITSASGQFTISGSISGSTEITLVFLNVTG